ncbi:hypothetical protein BpHYR1_006010 [Brachionus plicatilis]|uniref:Uncharacterized protein n=1 Tax=Brachionus plicatilis TaxID=10195 RepID=A0A3M7SWH5_BRAPC|nr:hypothetical protein BpHYR1_006010 [Brachionus plicatilis]
MEWVLGQKKVYSGALPNLEYYTTPDFFIPLTPDRAIEKGFKKPPGVLVISAELIILSIKN